MAQFKILRGSAEHLKTLKVTDGFIYFTPDDGRVYIDYSPEGNGETPIIGTSITDDPYVNRICINDTLSNGDNYLILDCGVAGGWAIVDSYFDCGDADITDEIELLSYDSGDADLIEDDEDKWPVYDSGDSLYNS